jgi:thiosulfate dehydrogenase
MSEESNPFERTARYSLVMCGMIMIVVVILIVNVFFPPDETTPIREAVASAQKKPPEPVVWSAPDIGGIPQTKEGDLIRYGRELIAHTAFYLGPKGKVASISNGMNCQNCHLAGGTKPFGNNYAFVASTYPRFRARSGTIESVEKRINDCIERSLNGHVLPDTSREIRAMKAYILWVGQEVPKDSTPFGGGLGDLPLLDRAADPGLGKKVFDLHCVRCHGPEGRGRRLDNATEWVYPPLVGDSSYNIGAGLYRLSRFAAYVRNNMPDGTTYLNPTLSVEEAWDVAAYINSLPRPSKDLSKDWPDISKKPFDHPFGPFADSFTPEQHKFGPFAQMKKK